MRRVEKPPPTFCSRIESKPNRTCQVQAVTGCDGAVTLRDSTVARSKVFRKQVPRSTFWFRNPSAAVLEYFTLDSLAPRTCPRRVSKIAVAAIWYAMRLPIQAIFPRQATTPALTSGVFCHLEASSHRTIGIEIVATDAVAHKKTTIRFTDYL